MRYGVNEAILSENILLIEQLYLAHRDKIDKMLRKEIEDLIAIWK